MNFSFLDDIKENININLKKIQPFKLSEGFDHENVQENINSSGVHFSEICKIDITNTSFGGDVIKDIKMPTSGVTSGVEWRFKDNHSLKEYNTFVEARNKYKDDIEKKK